MSAVFSLPTFPAPFTPAPDMQDLARVIRALFDVRNDFASRTPLGGTLFDVVITGGGSAGRAAVAAMDTIQLGTCGPVIEDPDAGWLYWLVPPGTIGTWEPHNHGVCLGSPHRLTMPTLNQSHPPGPYWLRPCKSDRLVPPRPLRAVLGLAQPLPTPHEGLSALLSASAANRPERKERCMPNVLPREGDYRP